MKSKQKKFIQNKVPLLTVVGLSKSFPGVQALSNIPFEVRLGEVHCLIGENGAGKSTLVKILSGVQQADQGTIKMNGQTCTFHSPLDAQNAGIACIFQELNVVGGLTVAENIMLGAEPGRFGLFSRQEAERQSETLLHTIGFDDVKPAWLCGDLSSAQKQAVMIAKALKQNTQIIIMDEPSSPLDEAEVHKLFEVIANLKARDKGIVYVSHKMREINELADRVTVFKDGHHVATLNRGDFTSESLVRLMVGREISQMFPPKDRTIGDNVVLEVKDLTSDSLKNIHFSVRRGEVLGIAGLVGAGRTELLRTIFGADPIEQGEIRILDQKVQSNSIPNAIRAGMALIPEERRTQSIFPMLSVSENIGFVWNEFSGQRGDYLDLRTARDNIINLLQVKTPNLKQRISTLSGGNQQKVVLGRWLMMKTQVLLLDEPTRGIDVGTKREIYRMITDLASQGLAVVLVTSELPELLGLADRLMVLHDGAVIGELSGNPSEEDVIAMSMLHTI